MHNRTYTCVFSERQRGGQNLLGQLINCGPANPTMVVSQQKDQGSSSGSVRKAGCLSIGLVTSQSTLQENELLRHVTPCQHPSLQSGSLSPCFPQTGLIFSLSLLKSGRDGGSRCQPGPDPEDVTEDWGALTHQVSLILSI